MQELKKGDKGDDVLLLQRALLAAGEELVNPATGKPTKADGDYGAATEAAVKKFQARPDNKGLLVSGVADAATQRCLGVMLLEMSAKLCVAE